MIEIEKYINDKGLFDGRYLLLRQLSTAGGTADVWLAEDKDTEDEKLADEDGDEIVKVEGSAVLVAIKIYRPKNILDAEGIQTFKKEYKTVYNCHHANLLKPTGFSIIDESIPYLIMPYCEKGSVEKLVGKLSDKDDIWKFIFDTASGLAYLHSCNPPIVHQDIKPANILIDDKNNYCITDFGISVKSGKDSENYLDDENSGTIIYMPPERFMDGYEPNAKSDVWSLGATIYELITGDVPFGDKGGEKQLKAETVPEIKAKIPKKIKSLVYACLDANSDKRPSAEAIAEVARKKGKKYFTTNALVLLSIIIIAFAIIVWNNTNTAETENPFVSLCNSGDSIINIEKDHAVTDIPIDIITSRKRLNEAVDFYNRALQEKEGIVAKRRVSITNKIEAIRNLSPLYDIYEGVCDSLKMAIEDGAEIQSELLKNKRDNISDKIKEIIVTL
jgi:serine/threonine protein kinase